MGQAKPWQIAVLVVGLLVLGVSLARSMFGDKGVEFNQELVLVDVTTGKLYRVDREKNLATFIPARHPQTGEATLYKAVKQEDGKWYVSGRQLEDLSSSKLKVSGVDPKSGLISNQDQKPESIELK